MQGRCYWCNRRFGFPVEMLHERIACPYCREPIYLDDLRRVDEDASTELPLVTWEPATTLCLGCGSQISTEAEACPKCGRPTKPAETLKSAVGIVAAIVLGFIAFAVLYIAIHDAYLWR